MNPLSLLLSPVTRRGLGPWVVDYLLPAGGRRAPAPDQPVHLLLCIADHHEPKWGGATPHTASRRLANWTTDYPELFSRFRDCDGMPPRHTFFYPIDQYHPDHV